MKKTISVFTITLALIAFVFYACKKQKPMAPNSTNGQAAASQSQLSSMMAATNETIELTVPAESSVVAKEGGLEEGMRLQIENKGASVLICCRSEKTDSKCSSGLEVSPGEISEVGMSELGSPNEKVLIITNPGKIECTIVIIITPPFVLPNLPIFNDILCVNGKLSFSSMSQFLAVMAYLEQQIDAGGDEDAVLLAFEKKFPCYTSLRSDIAKREDAWLEEDGENIGDDPDEHFVEDDITRTLLNINGCVIIEGTTYTITENGYIKTNSSGTIVETGSTSPAIVNKTNAVTNNSNGAGGPVATGLPTSCQSIDENDCNTNKRLGGFKVSGSNRIKWKVGHRTYPWNSRNAFAKTKGYKAKGKTKKGKTKWRKTKSTLYAQAYGFISDLPGDCSKELNFNTTGEFKEKSSRRWVTHRMQVETKTKPCWILGKHKGFGIEHSSVLVW